MKIYLIRHTSVGIESGICYGQTDVPLAHSFEEEREIVSSKLNGLCFDVVYSSPLSRCSLLSSYLFKSNDVRYDNRLKELNFGDWEMLSWDEIYKRPEGKAWMDNYLELQCATGECYNDLFGRVKTFVDDLLCENPGNVAIVTHAGVIRTIKSIIEEVSMDDLFTGFKLDYGQVDYLDTKEKYFITKR